VIEARAAQVVNMPAVLDGLAGDPITLETQASLIRARDFAARVSDMLPADARLPPPPPPSPVERHLGPLLAAVSDPLGRALPSAWLARIGNAQVAAEVRPPAPPTAPPSAASQDEFLAGLQVEVSGRLISIGYTSTDAEYAARVANAFAELYVSDLLQSKRGATEQATAWLAQRVEELRDEVRRSETAIARFRASNELVELAGNDAAARRIIELSAQRTALDSERTEKLARLNNLRQLRTRGGLTPELVRMTSSAVLVNLLQQQVQIDRQLAQLGEQYGERHPIIRDLRSERESVARSITAEIEGILSGLESEIAVLDARDRALVARIEEAHVSAAAGKQAEVQLRELERESEANRTLYIQFLARLKETTEQRALIQADARVVTSAVAPLVPSFPRPMLIVSASFAASLLVGTLFAFLVEQLDGRVRSAWQVERALGVRNLAMVPAVGRRLRGRGKLLRYLRTQPLSAYAEAVRGLATLVQFSAGDSASRVVLVTSTLPNEGKTTLAVSLATSLALLERRTILLELDLRRPGLHQHLQRAPMHGIAEYLSGGNPSGLKELIQPDPAVAGLDVLRVEEVAGNPVSLLGSPELERLIRSLRASYEWIILDAPPVLGLSDTRLIAQHADHVLFVVRWNRTTQEAARNGLRVLLEMNARVLGTVVTQVDMARHAKLHYGDPEQHYGAYRKYYVT
ncbi:MAG TPA: GNVR domain-containing protein, partial [Geminicoccaceae bacterium]|nr:GNVR domain-containing protein [Geminicoccaceae bacterium]